MLTHRDLKIIQEGNRRHPDIMTLLREVKRLRDLAALTYSVMGYMPVNCIPTVALQFADELRQTDATIRRAYALHGPMEFRVTEGHRDTHRAPGALTLQVGDMVKLVAQSTK